MLADGSTLSGKLTFDEQNLVLAHDVLGPVKLGVTDVVRITRSLPEVTRLTALQGEILEQVGPIPPPAPQPVQGESGKTLRIFPRTVIRYTLPQSGHARRFRAVLAPVANSRAPVTVRIRTPDSNWTHTVPPDTAGMDIDIELGQAREIEIITDTPGTISYPSGIEWRNAFIVEEHRQ